MTPEEVSHFDRRGGEGMVQLRPHRQGHADRDDARDEHGTRNMGTGKCRERPVLVRVDQTARLRENSNARRTNRQ